MLDVTVTLAAETRVPSRPFTDPGHLERDTKALEHVRGAMRRRLADAGAGGVWHEPGGDEHLLVLPDVTAVRVTKPVVAVGFFGQARADVDHDRIVELERRLLCRASTFRGLLAYQNVRFAALHQWGNLVLFADHDAPRSVASDEEHRMSIAAAPAHYHSLRLHRFDLPDGALGQAPLRWIGTTYLDFAQAPPWRAVRSADG